MLDFLWVYSKPVKLGVYEIGPKFIIGKPEDLMIRGGDFYAIWDEARKLWSTDESDAIRLIDDEIDAYAEKEKSKGGPGVEFRVLHMWDSSSGVIDKWHKYCQKQLRDWWKPLDEKIIFSDVETTKKDYSTHKLSYPLKESATPAYDDLMATLYSDTERRKIEWAIGSIIHGDSKKIEKFLVLYGSPGTGKGTVIKIIKKLFEGYGTDFSSKTLGQGNASFALEQLSSNPLVAYDNDGDMSRIDDNTRLNTLISHEGMVVNEKFKKAYTMSFITFMFIASNKPVKIADAKSGLIRRLIDVNPTGVKIPKDQYDSDMAKIPFELGGIAYRCWQVYLDNMNLYDDYMPSLMMGATNDFYNYVEEYYYEFEKLDGIAAKAAYEWYTKYNEMAGVKFPYPFRQFKEELKNYFNEYYESYILDDDTPVRSYYKGFNFKFGKPMVATKRNKYVIKMEEIDSIFDDVCKDCLAQYATFTEKPRQAWADVKTILSGIDTHKIHYVKPPENMIVIDFDLKDDEGNKSFAKNLEAASKWPKTYAELSKGGAGIHLHYFYDGDVTKLSAIYGKDIEIKVFTGGSSLRRKLTKCNNLPITTLVSGLKTKEEKKVLNQKQIKSERSLRDLINRCLAKEVEPYATKPLCEFILKILDEAYESGLSYDLTSMRNSVAAFAAHSTHNAQYCIRLVNRMKFKSDDRTDIATSVDYPEVSEDKDGPIAFFDVEIFDEDPDDADNPGLFIVCYKFQGENKPVMKMLNPSPEVINELFIKNPKKIRWIGFNNRKYDNHMIFARAMGYSPHQLYNLSSGIIGSKTEKERQKYFFGSAYDISYTDIYDFASAGNKKGLKKWEIELEIHHQEMGWPWDKPLPKYLDANEDAFTTDNIVSEETAVKQVNMWEKAAEYCANDVIATEHVFNHLKGDYEARVILAKLAEVIGHVKATPNDTSNTLSRKIIFGADRESQKKLIYRNLGEKTDDSMWCYEDYLLGDPKAHVKFGKPYFPGYKQVWSDIAKKYISIYRDEDGSPEDGARNGVKEVGEGGYVYAEPGMYFRLGDLPAAQTQDVASMHPTSGILEMYLGPEGTKIYSDLKQLRVYIKHKDFDSAKKMFGGVLAGILEDESQAKAISNALKTVLNSLYGLSSASFDNAFRHPDNQDNLIAKRGALFMIDLKHAVQEQGFKVIHIKTDSIKIANPTPEIIKFINDMGAAYGYEFETEAVFDRVCLVNNAVYISKQVFPDGTSAWEATGKQFQVPFVFKTLFSHEPIEFGDTCVTIQSRTGPLYLDMNENLPDVSLDEKEFKKYKTAVRKETMPRDDGYEVAMNQKIATGHDYHFIGNIGQFTPVEAGAGGGVLYSYRNGSYSAPSGTKGYRFLESETIRNLKNEVNIDIDYFVKLADDAKETIEKFGDFEMFVSEDDVLEIDPAETEHPTEFDQINIPEGIDLEIPFS